VYNIIVLYETYKNIIPLMKYKIKREDKNVFNYCSGYIILVIYLFSLLNLILLFAHIPIPIASQISSDNSKLYLSFII